MNTATPLGKLIDDLLREASQDGEQWTLFRDAAWLLAAVRFQAPKNRRAA